MTDNLLDKYKTLVETSFRNAENNHSKITDEIITMNGMSGNYTRHFYNNLLQGEDSRYLEIGTWAGSTVCSAMCGNKAKVVCIDNWSQFSGPKEEFLQYFTKFKGENDAQFLESDCFSVDVSILPKFNIYMYDGDHSYGSHYKALSHYYGCLDEIFIYIVDDWNFEDVRKATHDAIQDLNLKILYQKGVRLTHDGSHTPPPQSNNTWWNGIYFAILQKQ